MAKLNKEQRGKLIDNIVGELKIAAFAASDHTFCAGDTFFSLAFKTDEELLNIAKVAGV